MTSLTPAQPITQSMLVALLGNRFSMPRYSLIHSQPPRCFEHKTIPSRSVALDIIDAKDYVSKMKDIHNVASLQAKTTTSMQEQPR